MIKTSTIIELECDNCGETHSHTRLDSSRVYDRHINRLIQEEGWIQMGEELFCSKKCALESDDD